MSWLLLVLISVVAVSVAKLLQRVLLKDDKSDAVAYSIVFQFICGLSILAFALFNGFIWPPISALPYNFILMTVLYAGGTLLLFKALQTIEISDSAILSSFGSIWAIAAGLFFLEEIFNLNKVLGVVLILSAVILVSYKKNSSHLSKGTLYMLASAVCYGVAFANDAVILKQAEVFSFTAIAFILPGLLLLVAQPSAVKHMKPLLEPKYLIKMVLLGIFYSVSAITIYMAYQSGGPVSVLSPIAQSSTILTIILAAIFLGERDRMPQKFFAALLAIGGILLLR